MEDNVRMNLREIGWEVMDWSHLIENRSKWRAVCECDNESLGAVHGGEFLD
jgi:hypothetical protein